MILSCKCIGKFIIGFILVLAVFGIFSIYNFNVLPTKFLLIVLVSLLCILFLSTTLIRGRVIVNKYLFVITTISVFYIFVTFLNSVILHKVYFLDYCIAYLSFFYLIVLSILYNKIPIDPRIFKKFFYILLCFFFLKYLITRIFGFMNRPGIFTENNYELLFLAFLILAYHHIYKKISFLWIVIIFSIYILSESRSGILILATLLIFIFSDFSRKKDLLRFFIIFIVSSISVFMVMKYRMASLSIEDTDRFRFFLVFLREIKGWNILNFLFGKHPLTPLSYQSCQELSFYKSLFSYSGKNICYAIILHAYVLRVLFNHGILGFIFVFYSVYKIILLSGYSNKEAFLVLLLLLINGLSVSSINNIFSVLGLLFLTNLGYVNKCIICKNYVSKLVKIQTSEQLQR